MSGEWKCFPNDAFSFFLPLCLFIFLLKGGVVLAFDREEVELELINNGEYDKVIELVEPIIESENCEPFDYSYLIFAHMSKGDFSNALIYSNKWINKTLAEKDTTNLLKASRYKTTILYSLNDLDGSIESAEFSLRYYNKTDSVGITKTLLRLGLFQFEKEKYKLAYNTYSGLNYENVVLADREDEYFTNFGIIYAKNNDFDSSIYCFQRSLGLKRELKDPYGSVLCYSNIASSYLDLENYDLALIYLDSTSTVEIDPNSRVFQLVYQNYYTFYKETGQLDSALAYVERIKNLNDFLFQDKMNEEILELENSYKREANLKTKIVQFDTELETSKRQLLWLVIIILLIIIITGGTILLLRYKNLKSSRDNLLITQRLLRSQITPHFLYNSLSAIQGMILKGENKGAAGYLSKFSRLVRLILNNSRSQFVKLPEELEAIQYYLDLQNVRFREKLEYVIEVSEDIDQRTCIPPMLIQPFVENSIEHGLKNVDRKGKIEINVYLENQSLVCKITDNGIGVNAMASKPKNQKKESLSTAITTERLQLLARDLDTRAGLQIIDRKEMGEQGTIVLLTLPYKYD